MLVIVHGGQTTIERVRRDSGHRGRYWLLNPKGSASDAMYWAALEFSERQKAEKKLKRRDDSKAVFDVLTHEMWTCDNGEIRKVYDHQDGWI